MAALVPVTVVEDHDEALVVIYRAIGSKLLPMKGVTLIHFDAHPDLLSPNLPADDFCDKEKLFAYTSIAEWILPAVYMGHIGCVVWIKPPWCPQIVDGEHILVVGRDTTTGHLRVATPLGYFISDQLYAPIDRLTNIRTIPLHVVTLPVLQEGGENLPEDPYSQRRDNPRPNESSSPEAEKRDSCLSDITSDTGSAMGGVVGSRRSPLAGGLREPSEIFGEEESFGTVVDSCKDKDEESISAVVDLKGEVVKLEEGESEEDGTELPLKKKSRLEVVPSPPPLLPTSQTHTPSSHSSLMSRAVSVVCAVLEKGHSSWVLDVDLDFFSTANPFCQEFSQEEYTFLERLYKFKEPSSNSQESVDECVLHREKQLESLLDLWSEEDPLIWDQFSADDQELISVLKDKIGTISDGAPIESEDLHLAGMMTDLPHHISSDAEIRGLFEATSQLLNSAVSTVAGLPALVTIARSVPSLVSRLSAFLTNIGSKVIISEGEPGNEAIVCRYCSCLVEICSYYSGGVGVSLPVICPAILVSIYTFLRSEEDRYTPTDKVDQLQGDVVGVVKRLCASHIRLDYRYLRPGPLCTTDNSRIT